MMEICEKKNKVRKSLEEEYPELVKEWHPTKNGDLKPDHLSSGSHKKVWWYLPYDDPDTGKHFDFEWEDTVKNRTLNNNNCPFIVNQAVWQGYNDLVTTHPDISKKWHPSKNGDLKPQDVIAGSAKKVWWIEHYDDPVSGKHFDLEYMAQIRWIAKQGLSCPYLTGRKVLKGFNDLATVKPDIAAEWHPIKNGNLKPDNVTVYSGRKVWWYLPYDDPVTGKHFEFEWFTSVQNRSHDRACPYIANKKAWPGYNDLQTKYPQIAKYWDDAKNKKTVSEVMPWSNYSAWWKCPDCGHEWEENLRKVITRNCICQECAPLSGKSMPELCIYNYVKKTYKDAISGYKEFFTGKKELDIYIPSIKLAIEYDGAYWHQGEQSVKKEREKYKVCQEQGVKLIRIKEAKEDADFKNADETIYLDSTKYIKSLPRVLDQISDIIKLNTSDTKRFVKVYFKTKGLCCA